MLSVLPWFQWLGHTHIGVLMRDSTWGFALVEMAHLLALAGLGGTILIIDLRLLGFGVWRQPVSRIAKELTPLLWGSLAVMLVSGVLLLASGPVRYYHNPAFRIKMLLLTIAIGFYLTLHRRIIRSQAHDSTSFWTKAAAVVSLALWLGVGLAGRAIGLI
jgi:hypothetical protein